MIPTLLTATSVLLITLGLSVGASHGSTLRVFDVNWASTLCVLSVLASQLVLPTSPAHLLWLAG